MTEKKGRGKKKQKPDVFGITEEWQTAKYITTDPRGLKRLVREYNNGFGTDEDHQYYIVSGTKGYRLTQDKDEVMQSIAKEERLIKIRSKQAKRRRKHAQDFFTENERLPI